jgi:hypothetical protein
MTSAFCDSRNEHHKAKGITSGPYETGRFKYFSMPGHADAFLAGKVFCRSSSKIKRAQNAEARKRSQEAVICGHLLRRLSFATIET